MGLKIITPPSLAVVSTEMFMQHTIITDTQNTNLLPHYIETATLAFEKYTGLALRPQSFRLTFDDWFEAVKLPGNPVQTIDTFQYLSDGDWIDFEDYTLNSDESPALLIAYESPDLDEYESPRIKIEYTSGLDYNGSGSGVTTPADVQEAIMLAASHLYEQRSSHTDKTLIELPMGFYSIAANYKVGWEGYEV